MATGFQTGGLASGPRQQLHGGTVGQTHGGSLDPGPPLLSPSPQQLLGAAQDAEHQGRALMFLSWLRFIPVASCSALGKLYLSLSPQYNVIPSFLRRNTFSVEWNLVENAGWKF